MNTYCAHPLINAQVERLPGGDITSLLYKGQAQEISVNADGRIAQPITATTTATAKAAT